jgi:hypothetical protein
MWTVFVELAWHVYVCWEGAGAARIHWARGGHAVDTDGSAVCGDLLAGRPGALGSFQWHDGVQKSSLQLMNSSTASL